jgi:hypothetical protein
MQRNRNCPSTPTISGIPAIVTMDDNNNCKVMVENCTSIETTQGQNHFRHLRGHPRQITKNLTSNLHQDSDLLLLARPLPGYQDARTKLPNMSAEEEVTNQADSALTSAYS